MKISVIGGGPGGLYFSILLKKAVPSAQIDVYERNKADDSFGFGVVFSDETLSEFLMRDPESYELIRSNFAYWDDLDVARDGETVRITGNGFCGCSRKTLLQLLQQRCFDVGVNLHFEYHVESTEQFSDSDYIIAADGINSAIRERSSVDFGTQTILQRNKFVWLGSTRPLDAFTYFFRTTRYGAFVAHTYQYQPGMSTWIFECSQQTWENAGFSDTNEEDTIARLSEIYKEELDGHPLISNRSHWRQFPHITNERWSVDNIVLLGDAKATAHYSIGSGTKLAMECAIALSDSIAKHGSDKGQAFDMYDRLRRNRVEMIQHAANVSLDWFENMDRHIKTDFYRFAFGVMTRAKKVTYENLAIRDNSFTEKVLAEFNSATDTEAGTPPAFTPFSLRDLRLPNRISMPAMGQYSAVDGVVTDWHLMHYGARASGGTGLLITEMTAISAPGRITLGCAGIYSEEQVVAWKRITDFIHNHTSSKIAIQLGHSGRKGGIKKPWEGSNEPLDDQWELMAASPIPFSDKFRTPKEMSAVDMEGIIGQFVRAAVNADKAGFDMIELQAHHGYLLGSFLSPLTNQRIDEFGGSITNRLRFPLQVFEAVRAAFPAGKPVSVRISAHDWSIGGITSEDVITISAAFKTAGADIINVSTGNTVADQKPAIGRMWQTPFSDMVRNVVGIPTITAGFISDIDQINTIILNGRADLVALGKPLLANPSFVLDAMAYENFQSDVIPKPYLQGVTYIYNAKQSERREKEGMKRALKPVSHNKTK